MRRVILNHKILDPVIENTVRAARNLKHRVPLRLARKLRAGTITRRELERLASVVVVRSRHRRRHPERGARIALVDALGLAEDVDTVEEAEDLARLHGRG